MEQEQSKFELTEHELEFLKDIHRARALREMTQHPGWEFFNEIIDMILLRVQNQHLRFSRKASRDAYWLSGARLDAVSEFVEIIREQIAGSIDLLNQPLRMPNRNGNHPEGEE